MQFCGFGPFFNQFFVVLDFEAQFCSFQHVQHHGLQLLVLIIGGLQFVDVVHGFSVALQLIPCMSLYNATLTLWFRFSMILDVVLWFLAHFVVVLLVLLPLNVPLLVVVMINYIFSC